MRSSMSQDKEPVHVFLFFDNEQKLARADRRSAQKHGLVTQARIYLFE